MFTHSTKPKTSLVDTSDLKKQTKETLIPWRLVVFRDEIDISRVDGAAKSADLPEVDKYPGSPFYEVADGNHRLCAQLRAGAKYATALVSTYS